MQARDRTIETWFNRIRTGQLRLPRFQRLEAWEYENVAALIDSILRELPVGSTLVLEIGEKEPFVTRPLAGAPDPVERCTEHLLDGQQRLTALWRSLHDLYPDVTFFVQLKEPQPDEDGVTPSRIVRVKRWLNKDQRRFPVWADDTVEVYSRGMAPVSLLQPSDISAVRQQWCDQAVNGDLQASRNLEGALRDLQDKMKRFNLPMLVLDVGTKPPTALDVFVKMNTSAVPLNAFDVIVAQFEARTGKSMHALMIDLREKCPALESYVSPEQIALQTAALRADRVPAQASFFQLDLTDIDSTWDEIADGIKWAVQVLEEECVFDDQRLPTVTIMPVLAALYKYLPRELDEYGNARAAIRSYVWRSFITARYENASSTRSLQDYRALRDFFLGCGLRNAVPVFNETDYPLPTIDELIQAGWPKRKETLARAILAASIKAGAFDIADGNQATRQRLANREYHHLFPDSLLRDDGQLPGWERSRALNCILITMNTNRNISAKEPLKYLSERVDRADLGEAVVRDRLRSHMVPFDELKVGGYAQIEAAAERESKIRSDYQAFLRKRAEAIRNAFKALGEGRNWPSESV
ncbi:GmrSD restriction endonuclease domain-containing protein [Inquilinus sp. OTU3971]|uniref:GmrSD restriction endonuclease domain-containing protein n=1 Tax=Inquilinus sp. OTU3971 TaxID=3043855 RepID=UPI00313DA1ED